MKLVYEIKNGKPSDIYKESAIQSGMKLAKGKIKFIYGGSSVGLMGSVENAVLKNGGEVIGVIPKMLEEQEIAHLNLTELIVVESDA